jgi:hypothetical protein
VSLLLVLVVVAGCGGGSGGKRQAGLSPEEVVKTFFDAAKANNYSEAALYVAPGASNKDELGDITANANLLSVKKVAQQGDYAVIAATIQPEQNSLNVIFKTVGLEKINGEWYILDYNQIYQDAKYKVLQQLLQNI